MRFKWGDYRTRALTHPAGQHAIDVSPGGVNKLSGRECTHARGPAVCSPIFTVSASRVATLRALGFSAKHLQRGSSGHFSSPAARASCYSLRRDWRPGARSALLRKPCLRKPSEPPRPSPQSRFSPSLSASEQIPPSSAWLMAFCFGRCHIPTRAG